MIRQIPVELVDMSHRGNSHGLGSGFPFFYNTAEDKIYLANRECLHYELLEETGLGEAMDYELGGEDPDYYIAGRADQGEVWFNYADENGVDQDLQDSIRLSILNFLKNNPFKYANAVIDKLWQDISPPGFTLLNTEEIGGKEPTLYDRHWKALKHLDIDKGIPGYWWFVDEFGYPHHTDVAEWLFYPERDEPEGSTYDEYDSWFAEGMNEGFWYYPRTPEVQQIFAPLEQAIASQQRTAALNIVDVPVLPQSDAPWEHMRRPVVYSFVNSTAYVGNPGEHHYPIYDWLREQKDGDRIADRTAEGFIVSQAYSQPGIKNREAGVWNWDYGRPWPDEVGQELAAKYNVPDWTNSKFESKQAELISSFNDPITWKFAQSDDEILWANTADNWFMGKEHHGYILEHFTREANNTGGMMLEQGKCPWGPDQLEPYTLITWSPPDEELIQATQAKFPEWSPANIWTRDPFPKSATSQIQIHVIPVPVGTSDQERAPVIYDRKQGVVFAAHGWGYHEQIYDHLWDKDGADALSNEELFHGRYNPNTGRLDWRPSGVLPLDEQEQLNQQIHAYYQSKRTSAAQPQVEIITPEHNDHDAYEPKSWPLIYYHEKNKISLIPSSDYHSTIYEHTEDYSGQRLRVMPQTGQPHKSYMDRWSYLPLEAQEAASKAALEQYNLIPKNSTAAPQVTVIPTTNEEHGDGWPVLLLPEANKAFVGTSECGHYYLYSTPMVEEEMMNVNIGLYWRIDPDTLDWEYSSKYDGVSSELEAVIKKAVYEARIDQTKQAATPLVSGDYRWAMSPEGEVAYSRYRGEDSPPYHYNLIEQLAGNIPEYAIDWDGYYTGYYQDGIIEDRFGGSDLPDDVVTKVWNTINEVNDKTAVNWDNQYRWVYNPANGQIIISHRGISAIHYNLAVKAGIDPGDDGWYEKVFGGVATPSGVFNTWYSPPLSFMPDKIKAAILSLVQEANSSGENEVSMKVNPETYEGMRKASPFVMLPMRYTAKTLGFPTFLENGEYIVKPHVILRTASDIVWRWIYMPRLNTVAVWDAINGSHYDWTNRNGYYDVWSDDYGTNYGGYVMSDGRITEEYNDNPTPDAIKAEVSTLVSKGGGTTTDMGPVVDREREASSEIREGSESSDILSDCSFVYVPSTDQLYTDTDHWKIYEAQPHLPDAIEGEVINGNIIWRNWFKEISPDEKARITQLLQAALKIATSSESSDIIIPVTTTALPDDIEKGRPYFRNRHTGVRYVADQKAEHADLSEELEKRGLLSYDVEDPDADWELGVIRDDGGEYSYDNFVNYGASEIRGDILGSDILNVVIVPNQPGQAADLPFIWSEENNTVYVLQNPGHHSEIYEYLFNKPTHGAITYEMIEGELQDTIPGLRIEFRCERNQIPPQLEAWARQRFPGVMLKAYAGPEDTEAIDPYIRWSASEMLPSVIDVPLTESDNYGYVDPTILSFIYQPFSNKIYMGTHGIHHVDIEEWLILNGRSQDNQGYGLYYRDEDRVISTWRLDLTPQIEEAVELWAHKTKQASSGRRWVYDYNSGKLHIEDHPMYANHYELMEAVGLVDDEAIDKMDESERMNYWESLFEHLQTGFLYPDGTVDDQSGEAVSEEFADFVRGQAGVSKQAALESPKIVRIPTTERDHGNGLPVVYDTKSNTAYIGTTSAGHYQIYDALMMKYYDDIENAHDPNLEEDVPEDPTHPYYNLINGAYSREYRINRDGSPAMGYRIPPRILQALQPRQASAPKDVHRYERWVVLHDGTVYTDRDIGSRTHMDFIEREKIPVDQIAQIGMGQDDTTEWLYSFYLDPATLKSQDYQIQNNQIVKKISVAWKQSFYLTMRIPWALDKQTGAIYVGRNKQHHSDLMDDPNIPLDTLDDYTRWLYGHIGAWLDWDNGKPKVTEFPRFGMIHSVDSPPDRAQAVMNAYKQKWGEDLQKQSSESFEVNWYGGGEPGPYANHTAFIWNPQNQTLYLGEAYHHDSLYDGWEELIEYEEKEEGDSLIEGHIENGKLELYNRPNSSMPLEKYLPPEVLAYLQQLTGVLSKRSANEWIWGGAWVYDTQLGLLVGADYHYDFFENHNLSENGNYLTGWIFEHRITHSWYAVLASVEYGGNLELKDEAEEALRKEYGPTTELGPPLPGMNQIGDEELSANQYYYGKIANNIQVISVDNYHEEGEDSYPFLFAPAERKIWLGENEGYHESIYDQVFYDAEMPAVLVHGRLSDTGYMWLYSHQDLREEVAAALNANGYYTKSGKIAGPPDYKIVHVPGEGEDWTQYGGKYWWSGIFTPDDNTLYIGDQSLHHHELSEEDKPETYVAWCDPDLSKYEPKSVVGIIPGGMKTPGAPVTEFQKDWLRANNPYFEQKTSWYKRNEQMTDPQQTYKFYYQRGTPLSLWTDEEYSYYPGEDKVDDDERDYWAHSDEFEARGLRGGETDIAFGIVSPDNYVDFHERSPGVTDEELDQAFGRKMRYSDNPDNGFTSKLSWAKPDMLHLIDDPEMGNQRIRPRVVFDRSTGEAHFSEPSAAHHYQIIEREGLYSGDDESNTVEGYIEDPGEGNGAPSIIWNGDITQEENDSVWKQWEQVRHNSYFHIMDPWMRTMGESEHMPEGWMPRQAYADWPEQQSGVMNKFVYKRGLPIRWWTDGEYQGPGPGPTKAHYYVYDKEMGLDYEDSTAAWGIMLDNKVMYWNKGKELSNEEIEQAVGHPLIEYPSYEVQQMHDGKVARRIKLVTTNPYKPIRTSPIIFNRDTGTLYLGPNEGEAGHYKLYDKMTELEHEYPEREFHGYYNWRGTPGRYYWYDNSAYNKPNDVEQQQIDTAINALTADKGMPPRKYDYA